jgi:hypothetical protein
MTEGQRSNGHANGSIVLRLPTERDSGDPGERFSFIYPHQIKLRPRTWLYTNLIPLHGFGVLFGPSGCGKSFLAIYLALCAACGLDFLGRKGRRVGVIYVAAEDASGVEFRLVAGLKAHGIDRDAEDPIPLAIIPEAPDLWDAEAGDADALVAAVNAEADVLREHGATPGLIVIDTMRDALPGMEENSSEQMSAAIRTFRRIGKETGCLVLVVHHVPKQGDGEDPRGSSALIGAADVALGVRLETLGFEGNDPSPPMQRVLWVRKQRNGPDAKGDRALRWAYRLNAVDLDIRGDDGEPEHSCVFEADGAPIIKAPKRAKLPDRAVVALQAIKAALSTAGQRAPAGANIPAWAVVVRSEIARDNAGNIGLCPDTQKDPAAALRMAFNRAKQDLLSRGLLHEMEGWLWLPRQ